MNAFAGALPFAILSFRHLVWDQVSKTETSRWYASPDWWVVIVAALTGMAIAYQAREMRRSTGVMGGQLEAMRGQLTEMGTQTGVLEKSVAHAEKSAEAALLNARAIINAERPWMIIEPTPIPNAPWSGYVSLDAYNRGRTPAEITNYQGDFFFHGFEEEFGLEPTFAPLERLYRQYISPGNRVSVYGFDIGASLPQDQWQWMHKERKRLYFKGRIVYRDLITREEHESRFCYWLSPAEGVGLIMGGDRNWNKYT
jgi:hypothetical protein